VLENPNALKKEFKRLLERVEDETKIIPRFPLYMSILREVSETGNMSLINNIKDILASYIEANTSKKALHQAALRGKFTTKKGDTIVFKDAEEGFFKLGDLECEDYMGLRGNLSEDSLRYKFQTTEAFVGNMCITVTQSAKFFRIDGWVGDFEMDCDPYCDDLPGDFKFTAKRMKTKSEMK